VRALRVDREGSTVEGGMKETLAQSHSVEIGSSSPFSSAANAARVSINPNLSRNLSSPSAVSGRPCLYELTEEVGGGGGLEPNPTKGPWECTFFFQYFAVNYRLHMELDLQSIFGLHVHSCTHRLRPHMPHPPFSRIWAHVRGRYWSAKIDNISL
jgi:hypothetical protein